MWPCVCLCTHVCTSFILYLVTVFSYCTHNLCVSNTSCVYEFSPSILSLSLSLSRLAIKWWLHRVANGGDQFELCLGQSKGGRKQEKTSLEVVSHIYTDPH